MIAVDQPWSDACARPAALNGRVFVAGVADDQATLRAFDIASQRELWCVTFPADEACRETSHSSPVPRADGGAWLAVHEYDVHGVLFAVDGDGKIEMAIELVDPGLDPQGDLGTKVHLRLAPGVDDGVLVSYTYRQVRTYGTTLYSRTGASVWAATDWLLAANDHVAITTPPLLRASGKISEQAMYFARDARTGEVLWQTERSHVNVAALVDNTLYLVDRSAVIADIAMQEHRAYAMAETIDDGTVDAELAAIRPRLPMQLRALDAMTGAERWILDGGPRITSVVATSEGVAVLSHELDGSLRVKFANHAGAWLAEHMLDETAPSDPLGSTSDHATLITAGDSLVIAVTKTRWTALVFDGVLRASGTLADNYLSWEPRTFDRWLTVANAIVAADRLIVRKLGTLGIDVVVR